MTKSKYPDDEGLKEPVRELEDCLTVADVMKDHYGVNRPQIKELVRGNAEFQYYKDSQLWYKTVVGSFIFPVPIEDVGTATLNRVEKGLLMMRYIRKHLAVVTPSNDIDDAAEDLFDTWMSEIVESDRVIWDELTEDSRNIWRSKVSEND